MKDGGQAFACVDGTDGGYLQEGMTLRQYYKAVAINGLLANGDWSSRAAGQLAADIADEMLAEDDQHERTESGDTPAESGVNVPRGDT